MLLLEKEPDEPLALWAAALALLKSGNTGEARRYLEYASLAAESPFIASVAGKTLSDMDAAPAH